MSLKKCLQYKNHLKADLNAAEFSQNSISHDFIKLLLNLTYKTEAPKKSSEMMDGMT